MPEPYPLDFPAHQPRTPAHQRQRAVFQVGFAQARDELLKELELLRASKVVISSNITLRRDGLPYANSRKVEDPGVAVHFTWNKTEYVFACDYWDTAIGNMRAIGLHIATLRPVLTERWHVGKAEQALSGYKALPVASTSNWRTVLGATESDDWEAVRKLYLAKAQQLHPDTNKVDYSPA